MNRGCARAWGYEREWEHKRIHICTNMGCSGVYGDINPERKTKRRAKRGKSTCKYIEHDIELIIHNNNNKNTRIQHFVKHSIRSACTFFFFCSPMYRNISFAFGYSITYFRRRKHLICTRQRVYTCNICATRTILVCIGCRCHIIIIYRSHRIFVLHLICVLRTVCAHSWASLRFHLTSNVTTLTKLINVWRTINTCI